MGMREAVFLALSVGVYLWREVSAAGQLSSACTTDAGCAAGLYCFSCAAAGATATTCTTSQATPVSTFAKNYSLPYNKYAWITTHNSYAIKGAQSLFPGQIIISGKNQEDTVTSQLNNGVRGLMLDMYDFMGDVWLCHSYLGKCYEYTAFQPVNGTLIEIEKFLAANPNEVVTIFIEDYVTSSNGLTKAFTAAGLVKYMFPLASMPTAGADWPTVAEMIAKNQRLLVFTSIKSKEASESIAYQWNYVVENQYGSLAETCPNRAESAAMNDTTKSLVLENYFPTNPNISTACVDNSDNLEKALKVCYTAAGKRWSNFVAVDMYERSTGGGVFKAVDTLNGEFQCGCNDIYACKGSSGFGVCSAVTTPTTTPTTVAPTSPLNPANPNTQVTTSPGPNVSLGTSPSGQPNGSTAISLSRSILCVVLFLTVVFLSF